MSYCAVSDTSANVGAALSISYDSTLELNNSTFSNLYAFEYGGISLSLNSKARIHDTIFFNCSALSTAAGIMIESKSELGLNNTVF